MAHAIRTGDACRYIYICVCVCVCVCVCFVLKRLNFCECMHVCMCVCIYACHPDWGRMQVYVLCNQCLLNSCVCLHTRIHRAKSSSASLRLTETLTCIYIHTCIYTYIHTYTCIHTLEPHCASQKLSRAYIHTYTHTHTHTHAHTHTHTYAGQGALEPTQRNSCTPSSRGTDRKIIRQSPASGSEQRCSTGPHPQPLWPPRRARFHHVPG